MLKKKGFICMMVLFLLLLGSAQVKAEFKVYDANGQYLGILVSLNNTNEALIYIPSLKAIFGVNMSYLTINKDTGICTCYDLCDISEKGVYKNNSCSGTTYVASGEFVFPFIVESSNKLFLIDPKNVETVRADSVFVKTSFETCESLKSRELIENDFVNIVPLIPLSEDQLPFKLPIKLPLRLEYVPGGFDINGDGKIGLEEAIYSLQVAAGLRANPNAK